MQTEGGGEGGELIKKHLFKSAVFLFMFAGVAAAIFYFESRITPNFGENIFESVFNSTWTSSPITVSKCILFLLL